MSLLFCRVTVVVRWSSKRTLILLHGPRSASPAMAVCIPLDKLIRNLIVCTVCISHMYFFLLSMIISCFISFLRISIIWRMHWELDYTQRLRERGVFQEMDWHLHEELIAVLPLPGPIWQTRLDFRAAGLYDDSVFLFHYTLTYDLSSFKLLWILLSFLLHQLGASYSVLSGSSTK